MLRRTVDKKTTDKGLGSWPTVSLDEARAKAAAERAGAVPNLPVVRIAANAPTLSTPDFETLAREYYADRQATWKARAGAMNWIGRMENHVFPKVGRVPMADFNSAHALAVLKPLWLAKPATAQKLRVDIAAVVLLASAKRVAGPDARDAIALAVKALPRTPKTVGHEAMALEAVPGFMRELADIDADPLLRLALAFVVLTAKRSGEVRQARKAWIKGDVMVFPADVMKTGAPHREPLTPQARHILQLAAGLSGDSEYIFPNLGTGKPYSDMAMLMLLKRNGHTATVHGFRATFRTWAEEETDAPHAVKELALAHGQSSAVVAAYQRSDLEAKRRALMTEWATVATGAVPVAHLRIAA
jgi:integrase